MQFAVRQHQLQQSNGELTQRPITHVREKYDDYSAGRLIGLVVEQHADGLLTVFVPSAPTPTAGSIYFLAEQQVKRLDMHVSAAVRCITQLGVGTHDLLRGKIDLLLPTLARRPDVEKMN